MVVVVLFCNRVLVCNVSCFLWMVLYWCGRCWLMSVSGGGDVLRCVSRLVYVCCMMGWV